MKNFDNAATTKISRSSLEAYNKASDVFYNPSALYSESQLAKNIIEDTRQNFIKKFKGKPGSTFIFTGSASEANNSVLSNQITRKDKKYIFSAGEHSSIHNTAKYYQELGYNVVFIPLIADGLVDTFKLLDEVDSDTALVSIIHVSNETGAINDIKSICASVKAKNVNVVVHSDGVQAVGKFEINLKDLGVDFYTISAHKIHGPKGVGALYIANPKKFRPFIHGGGQEMGLRAGTENVPGIAAFNQAINDLKIIDFSEHKKAIFNNLSGDYFMVSNDSCVDNIISIAFKNVRSETILHMLESKGYLIGTGSACNSKAKQNRVISALVPSSYVEGIVRISFGEEISVDDCSSLAKELVNAVKIYREKTRK